MVFCNNCIYMKFVECAMGCVGYQCKAEVTEEHNAISKWWVLAQCKEKNKNNDCPDHKHKFWKFWRPK